MSREVKVSIVEGIILLVLIILIILALNVNLNLGIVKFVNIEDMKNNSELLETTTLKLETTKLSNTLAYTNLEKAKENYETEKSKYEAISQENIDMIEEATIEESYDIEYMWIKLGNYAISNNLSLGLTEPGSSATDSTTEETDESVISSSSTTTTTQTTTSENLKITVVGNYLDLAEFVFDVENDVELRFKLDKIKMTYAQSNNVSATFEVENVTLTK